MCLVAGDPIGPRTQWGSAVKAFVDHAELFGWVPTVLVATKLAGHGYTERGFSISLGRMGGPADTACLHLEAHFSACQGAR